MDRHPAARYNEDPSSVLGIIYVEHGAVCVELRRIDPVFEDCRRL